MLTKFVNKHFSLALCLVGIFQNFVQYSAFARVDALVIYSCYTGLIVSLVGLCVFLISNILA